MIDKNKEKLVSLIYSGHNTYRELKSEFPDMDESAWQYMGNSLTGRKDVAFSDKTCIPTKHPLKLIDSDTFRLTEYGENLLHQLHKEAVRDKQAAEAMALNKRIFAATLIGVAIAAIGVLIALLK